MNAAYTLGRIFIPIVFIVEAIQSFMAIGVQDPVMGVPSMLSLHAAIAGCPPPLRIEDGGHFVQEQGERIARAALAQWGSR